MMNTDRKGGGRSGEAVTIVFVCTGNTCRSPMAQRLLQDMLGEDGRSFKIKSAGVAAEDGFDAAAAAVEVMARRGLSLADHGSRRLSARLVRQADVLLTMTEAQREAVVGAHPEAADKTYTLKSFAGDEGDVEDPFGGDVARYEATAAELTELLQAVARRLTGAGGADGPDSPKDI